MAQSRAVLSTISQPVNAPDAEVPLLVGVEMRVVAEDVVVGGEEEPAGAAGRIADRLVGRGSITSTMAEMSARGVKYWPAPDLVSAAFFSSRPS